jgi:hypothetical protein
VDGGGIVPTSSQFGLAQFIHAGLPMNLDDGWRSYSRSALKVRAGGDTRLRVGASPQIGWTGLIADLPQLELEDRP